MATTEMPPAPATGPEPVPPARKAQPDAPTLLIQLQDELSRSRRREAFWISLILHLLLVIAIATAPKMFPARQPVTMTSAEQLMRDRELTFLELPPDEQKVTRRPDTNVISDKDRIASSRRPVLDRKELQRILDSARPGPPGAPAVAQQPASPAPAPPPAKSAAQGQPNAAEVAKNPGTPVSPAQTAQLQPLPPAGGAPGRGTPLSRGQLSPGSAIEQAARASAMSRGGGAGGDYGLGMGSSSGIRSNLDILSDTHGVDFGPYLARVLHDVRVHWYDLIPEIARAPMMKKGKVSIEFAILKTGQVAGMRLTGSSSDVALDRAAWGGITASNPFPPLPSDFGGSYLALRFHFYYNPDSNDLR